MKLKLYNTLGKKKSLLTPVESGHVKMYVCGPTVYDFLHVGNFRGAIFFNLVANWLREQGQKVTYVYNYTDIDDKIIKKAKEENSTSQEISERFIAEFEKDFEALELTKHDHNPRVTDFVPQIIEMVDGLIKKEKAYEVDGEVFYEVSSFKTYGKLSQKNLDDLEAGQRVEVDPRKKSPSDFVLWKPAKEGEPSWDSPWGKGRPGWHIECSAMIKEILGDTIDIHGGGIDLIFPHHENEIAQGEGLSGKCYCNNWMHNGFLQFQDQKMSKSLGNVVTGRSFIESYGPEVLKFYMLSVHYRAPLQFGPEKISQTLMGLERFYEALEKASLLKDDQEDPAQADEQLIKACKLAEQAVEKALNDDFNTGDAFSHLFEVTRVYNGLKSLRKQKNQKAIASSNLFYTWLKNQGKKFSLFQQGPREQLDFMNNLILKKKNIEKSEIENKLALRSQARADKDFSLSDKLRDELLEMGVELRDGTLEGQSPWSMKKEL